MMDGKSVRGRDKTIYQLLLWCVILYLLASLRVIVHFWGSLQRAPRAIGIRLLNITDFLYVLNNATVCASDEDVFMVVVVPTAPGNIEKRTLIRQTWGRADLLHKRGLKHRVVFLLALTDSTIRQDGLEAESKLFGDIVQGSFVDKWEHLSYKSMMGVHWALNYCPGASFLLKVDDDVYFDVFRTATALWRTVVPLFPQPVLYCQIWLKGTMPVIRDKNETKYYLSRDQYPKDTFPEYCSGPAYAMTMSAAARIWNASKETGYFKLEDVHITGTLATNQTVRRIQSSGLVQSFHASDANRKEHQEKLSVPGTFWSVDLVMPLWYETVSHEAAVGLHEWQSLVEKDHTEQRPSGPTEHIG